MSFPAGSQSKVGLRDENFVCTVSVGDLESKSAEDTDNPKRWGVGVMNSRLRPGY